MKLVVSHLSSSLSLPHPSTSAIYLGVPESVHELFAHTPPADAARSPIGRREVHDVHLKANARSHHSINLMNPHCQHPAATHTHTCQRGPRAHDRALFLFALGTHREGLAQKARHSLYIVSLNHSLSFRNLMVSSPDINIWECLHPSAIRKGVNLWRD